MKATMDRQKSMWPGPIVRDGCSPVCPMQPRKRTGKSLKVLVCNIGKLS
jgi:hypothetical protein